MSVKERCYTDCEQGMVVKFSVNDGLDGTKDYNELKNHPTLNNKEIVGNLDEEDPTVPEWAKNENPPQELSFAEVKTIWDSIFSL